MRTLATIVVIVIAWFLAYELRFDGQVPPDREVQRLALTPLVVVVQLSALRLAGADRHSWRYTSTQDLAPLGAAVAATGTALLLVRTAAPTLAEEWPAAVSFQLPYGVAAMYTVLVGVGLVGARLLRRTLGEHGETPLVNDGEPPKRVLLLGAGGAGVIVARELRSRPDLGIVPVGFVDDEGAIHGRRVAQLDVLGGVDDLPDLVDELGIDEVVITIASADGATMRDLVARCEAANVRPLIVPGVTEIVGGSVSLSWFRPVEAEDLLGRDPVELDLTALDGLLGGRTVVVTGAGGSIGSELARQIVRFHPATLVLLEQSEPALWAIHRELASAHPGLALVAAVADVTDAGRVSALLDTHRPSIVFHAAAHKHVPLMEDNPGEAIKNNVLGTRTVVDACVDADVERFVLISTDKAVNPTSVMGATKRLAERYVQHVAHETGWRYASVRFGNVLGSTGSVVPIFQQQIAEGGPVTVTDPEMRRYFMTIPEASQLVLEAAALGESGEILVLDMGEPIRIVELAESLIRLSGREPYTDIAIEFTGLRPGEKLFEELSLTEEGADRTRHPKVWIGRTRTPDWGDADRDLHDIGLLANRLEADKLRFLLGELVPEYVITGDATLVTAELRVSSEPGMAP